MAGRVVSIALTAVENVSRTMQRVASDTDRTTAALERLNKVSRAGGMTIAASSATSLATAMAPAAAAVAALPAAMAAVKVASGTLKVGLVGVGDAMSAVAEGDAKALDESLKKLAPNARKFVVEANSMRSQVMKLQQAVQNRLFAGLATDLDRLGKNLLPTARKGMVSVAGALNGVGREAAKTANTAWFRGQVAQIMSGTTGTINTLKGAVDPLIRSVTMLAVAGMPLVQRMAEWAASGAKAFAEWLRLKIESGAVSAAIQRIGDVLGTLGGIAGNVAATIGHVASQSRMLGVDGQSLLTTIEQLTAKMSAWTGSAEGQQRIGEVFTQIGNSMDDVATVAPLLTGALRLMADGLAALPDDVQQLVIDFGAWALVINLLITRLGLLKVATVASTVATKAWGAATATAGAVGGFVTGLRNLNAAMAANATLSTRLGAALRAQILLWRQQAAAAGVSTARIIANAAAQKVAAAATRVWAAAQALFNAVASANPIALIVIAIVALVAAVVIAYKRSETFRNIVQTVWTAVKNAIATAWAFIKPIFLQIVHVLKNVIGTALRWYWAYVQFVFNAVKTIIMTAWGFIKPIFMAIVGVIRGVLGRAFTFLKNLVKIVWIAIQLQIKVGWTIVKAIFNAIKWVIEKVVAPAFKWLYNSIIKPVWNGIKAVIRNAWIGIKATWTAIKWVIDHVLAPVFRWLWKNVIVPVWNGIKTTISGVWNRGIRPAFDALKRGVGAVRSAFSTAVEAIRKIWDKLKDIAKKPVNFLIGTVYNKGVVGLVNKIAGFAGIDTRLSKIALLARGGTLGNPLAAGPMVTSGPTAIVGEGRRAYPEFVIPTDPAYRARAQKLWAQAGMTLAGRGGRGAMGGEGLAFAKGGSLQALEGGGIIGSFMKGLSGFSFLDPTKAFQSAISKVMGVVPGSGLFRDAVAGIPGKFVSWLVNWFKAKVGFGGGAGVSKGLNFAKAQEGKPYTWGGVGPGGYDCSGLWSAIVNVIKGRNPYSRLFTTFSFTGGSRGPEGFVRNLRSGVRVGVTNAGVGHMAGSLGRTPVESSGSAGVRVGGGARGADDGLFTMRYGLRADTGALALAPGWNPPTFNGTGRMEYLETPRRGGGLVIETGAIQVNAAPGTHPAAVGEAVVRAIQDYERVRGKGWRKS